MKRRHFLTTTSTATVAAVLPRTYAAKPSAELHLATNTYPWGTFAPREGRKYPLHSDELLAAIATSGITGYEPVGKAPAEFEGLAARLKAHGLEMRSLYVNSVLHEAAAAQQSIAEVLALARRAVELGTKTLVTNPSPIRWGGPENKTDAQLRTQAKSLDTLGAELRALGVTPR
jgi:inosose dehydratase